eukprot:6021832-Amphidinium_carterae.2
MKIVRRKLQEDPNANMLLCFLIACSSAVWRCSRLHRDLDEAFGRELAVRVTEELGPFKADLASDAESSSDDEYDSANPRLLPRSLHI